MYLFLSFRRVLEDILSSGFLLSKTDNLNTTMTYVRYLLTFKLWKRIVRGADQRRCINTLAVSYLQPEPDNLRAVIKSGVLNGILPNIPKTRPDITQFLMVAKFDAKVKTQVRVFYMMSFVG